MPKYKSVVDMLRTNESSKNTDKPCTNYKPRELLKPTFPY